MDSRFKIAAAVIFIILILYLTRHKWIPKSMWKSKAFRAFERNFAIENMIGDPNMVPKPIRSYYKSLPESESKITVGLHYTNWCPYCKKMKPVWEAVKSNLSGDRFKQLVMFENDEEINPTPGVTSYPTIIKYRGGKAREYKGVADYEQLRTWILSPFIVDTYGAAW